MQYAKMKKCKFYQNNLTESRIRHIKRTEDAKKDARNMHPLGKCRAGVLQFEYKNYAIFCERMSEPSRTNISFSGTSGFQPSDCILSEFRCIFTSGA